MYKKELAKPRTFKHWDAENTWHNMMQRCYNPKHKGYKNYGGRGIIVCKAWHSFKNFLEDMGDRPKFLTLERINNDGNYEPKNCRWADNKEQSNNKRNTLFVIYEGKVLTIRALSKKLNLNYSQTYNKFSREAFTL